MALHQDLELGLDIGALGVGFKPERIQRPALGVKDLAAFRGRPGLPVRLPSVPLNKSNGSSPAQPERNFAEPRRAVPLLLPTDPIFQVGRWPVRSSF